MQVSYSRTFIKQLTKLPAEYRKQAETAVFVELPKIEHIGALGKAEKMQGYTGFYKIRVGLYRIGIKIVDGTAEVRCVLHRKEIYRFFP